VYLNTLSASISSNVLTLRKNFNALYIFSDAYVKSVVWTVGSLGRVTY